MDSAVQQVTSYATGHADREIGYLVQFRRNTKNLEDKAQKLECTRNDLQRLISVAMNNNEVIRSIVTAWLEKVDIILDEVTKLKIEAEKINRWYKGFIYSRFRLGRKALKKTVDIQELIDERNMFGDLADPKPFQSMQVVSDGEFDAFASREDTARKIFEALHDERINLVGIFGMPGVGKTMLMQAILKEAKEKKLFDEIVMVTVSQHPDIERIQQGIAVQLGIHLAESSIAATQLSERLKQGKKILIALDDMWERLDLSKLGIPYKNIQGCKVLFTTRIEEVCDQMEAPAMIKVGILSKEDSRRLFRQKASDVMDSSSHKEVAEDVLNECKGLPLAIATLGLALRNKDEIVWLDARTQLQTSSFEGMDPVVSVVKLSYQFLKNETCRKCFLFCCLFPEDFVIQTDVLLSYMLGEKLLKNVYSIAEAKRRLHTIVDKLTSSGLLLKNEQGNIVMHDVIRDTAISIASGLEEGEGFIVMSGLRLELWPDINLENCKRLSLMSNDLKFEIPLQIRAPYLLTLCLSENRFLKEIPRDFFKEMTSLETLDLSCTDIESLPLSFPCLENLRTLRMDNCSRLSDISLVVKLKKLEILSAHGSSRVKLPERMRELSNLKILDLTSLSVRSSPHVRNWISNLSRLEELHFLGRSVNISSAEIASLARLTCLEMHLPVECFSQNIPTEIFNLSKFAIVIGRHRWIRYNLAEKDKKRPNPSIDLICLPPSNLVSNWVRVLLKRTKCLSIAHCYLKSFAELTANGMHNDDIHRDSYANLEELKIDCCFMLKNIMSKESTSSIFSKLKILEITSCVNLKFVLPMKATRDLSQLQELVISSCSELEMIFGDDGGDANDNKATLPCLKTITLRFLPRLSSFGRSGLIVDCPDLVKLEVSQCIRNLKRLPFSMQSIPKLKALVVHRNWFDRLKWTDESLKFHLQSLIQVEHSSYVGDMYFHQTSVDYFGGNDGEEDEEVASEEGGEVEDDGLNAAKQMARFYNMPIPVLAFIFTFLFFILFTTQF